DQERTHRSGGREDAAHLEEGHRDRGEHDLRLDGHGAARRRADRDPRLRQLPGEGARGTRGAKPEDRRARAHLGQTHAVLQGGKGAEGDGGRGAPAVSVSGLVAPRSLPPPPGETLHMRWVRRWIGVALIAAVLIGGWSLKAENAESIDIDFLFGEI